jgi:hypothetical protein
MHRIAELARLVDEVGGVLVAAHPHRRQLPFELRRDGDWSQALERAAANSAYRHVCAVETLNGRGSERENAFSHELRAAMPTRPKTWAASPPSSRSASAASRT